MQDKNNDKADEVPINQKDELVDNLEKNRNIILNGIDPGICSTVTMFSANSDLFFSYLNR